MTTVRASSLGAPDAGSIALSVLVTPTKSGGSLVRTLSSLARESPGAIRTEIVVVVPADRRDAPLCECLDRLKGLGHQLRVLHTEPGGAEEVPKWRARAYAAANGPVRVFLEDNAAVEPGWWRAWAEMAARDDWTIASGTVVADLAALDRASLGVFFCEYGLFVPSAAQGRPMPLKRVAGNHWAVNAAFLAGARAESGIDEHVWTHRHTAPGEKPVWVDGAIVRCLRVVGGGEAIAERARQGFRFGRDESRRAGPHRRIKMIACGHAIVFVQIARLVAVVSVRRNHRARLARASCWTFALLAAWSFAEWAGWCIGSIESFLHANLEHRAEPRRDRPERPGMVQSLVVSTDKPRT